MSATRIFSVEYKDAAKDGETKIRRNPLIGDGELLTGVSDNLYKSFLHGVGVGPDRPCLAARPIVDGVAQAYEWISYHEVNERVLNFGSGLLSLGVASKGIVGICAKNRIEWVISDLACAAFDMTSCPLYDTLGDEALEYILGQTQLAVVVCTADKAKWFLSLERSRLGSLAKLIIMDEIPDALVGSAESHKIELLSFADVIQSGKNKRQEPIAAKPEDIFTIMYTSGTTGLPKGALLSHGNFLCQVAAMVKAGTEEQTMMLGADDVHLSYLPLAHSFERLVVLIYLYTGGSIGFYQGDPLKIIDDAKALKPTVFISVPRLLNRVFAKVNSDVAAKGGLSAYLFNWACQTKKSGITTENTVNHWFWDMIVFSKVKEALGGRCRCIVTGSAPISPDVLTFLRYAFCVEVVEGYGLTENTAAACTTFLGDYEAGTVGAPTCSCEVKLVDVKDMNYTAKDTPYPRGEVCVRGPNIFKGYFKDDEKTKEAIDSDGWLHTGDIGLIDDKGRIKIIDRKKNIFKLSQGEYIAPEKIENVYANCPFVAQSFVHGESLKPYLVAIVVPDPATTLAWCKANGIDGDLAAVCQNPAVKAHILKEMNAVGTASSLKGFELAKGLYLDPEPFSVERDTLTPTFKLKRPQAKNCYKAQIEAMQSELDAKMGDK